MTVSRPGRASSQQTLCLSVFFIYKSAKIIKFANQRAVVVANIAEQIR